MSQQELGENTTGNIILLNGTSSSGKTTLAKALQGVMSQPYFHIGFDLFQQTFPPGFITYSDGMNPPAADGWLAIFREDTFTELHIGPAGHRLETGIYRAIAGFASAGNDLIVDAVIYTPETLRAVIQAFHTVPVLFVGVRCPLEVAERREIARGDRAIGGARTFNDHVHAHGVYDLEVDTSLASPEECALAIKEAIDRGHPRRAFLELARIPIL
jgi:chloramphenicol 3-O phosphotransferase